MFRSSAFVLEIDVGNTCRQVSTLPVEACRVLRLFDGHRGLAEVLDDSPLEVPKTLAVVQRLASQGLVRLSEKPESNGIPADFRKRKILADEVQGWLGIRAPQRTAVEDMEDLDLEAALDEILNGPDDGPEDNASQCVPLEAIADSMEAALERTLQVCSRLEDLLESHVEDLVSVDMDNVLLPAADPDEDYSGFSPMEEEFFDSYVPEEPDGDLEEILEEIRRPVARVPSV